VKKMKKSSLSTKIIGALVIAVGSFSAAVQGAGLNLSTAVDTEICASGAAQCGGNFNPANDSNHNPIRLFVQVTSLNGTPGTGLALGDFSFTNNLVPAGGGSTVICPAARCGANRFGGGTNGLYSIFLDRSPAGNWKAGTYAGTIKVRKVVDDVTYNGTALVTFTIPEAD